jgi:tRNA dimethylallyltransferase
VREADAQRAILIAGPTASGKSRVALAIAERLRGTVINADSMQVYRELRILTARPSAADTARVPHALYGGVPAVEGYSAGRYAQEVATAIARAREKARVPVIVGGTGLYFKALLEGLSPVPAVAAQVRTRWRAAGCERPAAELHAWLAERDPVMAGRLAPSDRQRIVRALEVLEGTGRSLAEWQREPGRGVLRAEETVGLVLTSDPATHAQRIAVRLEAMLREGAVDEVRGLRALELPAHAPILRALGVAPLMAYLAGSVSLKTAAELATRHTRQYAKRQLTWFRSNMRSWNWINEKQMERIYIGDIQFIENTLDRPGNSP